MDQDVKLTICAEGKVGSGKSRAIEVILAALKYSKIARIVSDEHFDSADGLETVVVQVVVKEPWKSER